MKAFVKKDPIIFILKGFYTGWISFCIAISPCYASEFIAPQLNKNAQEGLPFFNTNLGLNGSYTIISNSGYVLTALHNITFCLKTNNFYLRQQTPSVTNLISEKIITNTIKNKKLNIPYKYYKINKSVLSKGVFCHLPANSPQASHKLKVIFLGAKGWIPAKDIFELSKRYPQIFHQLRQDDFTGVGDIGDFALLQFVDKNNQPLNTKSMPCLKVTNSLPSNLDRVSNFSFPIFKRSHHQSFYNLHFTSGVIFDLASNPYLPLVDKQWLNPRTMTSTIDAETGSSGSSLLDQNGQIVGLVHLKLSDSEDYMMGTTAFIPSAEIVAKMEETLGTNFVNQEVLNGCKKNSDIEDLIHDLNLIPTHSM